MIGNLTIFEFCVWSIAGFAAIYCAWYSMAAATTIHNLDRKEKYNVNRIDHR